MKYIIYIVMIMLLCNIVLAVPPFTQTSSGDLTIEYPLIDYFKQNTARTFNFHVANSTTIITNTSATCTAEIYNVNGSHIFTKKIIPFDGYDFYINANAGNFSEIGLYSIVTYCNTSSQAGISKAAFKVNPTGTEYTTSQAILHIIFIITASAVFILVLIGAVKIPYNNPRNPDGAVIGLNQLKYLKIICIVFSYIIFTFTIGLVRGLTYNYVYEIGVYRLFNWMFWIMFSIMWPTIVVTLLLLLINLLEDKKIRKALVRGIDLDER